MHIVKTRGCELTLRAWCLSSSAREKISFAWGEYLDIVFWTSFSCAHRRDTWMWSWAFLSMEGQHSRECMTVLGEPSWWLLFFFFFLSFFALSWWAVLTYSQIYIGSSTCLSFTSWLSNKLCTPNLFPYVCENKLLPFLIGLHARTHDARRTMEELSIYSSFSLYIFGAVTFLAWLWGMVWEILQLYPVGRLSTYLTQVLDGLHLKWTKVVLEFPTLEIHFLCHVRPPDLSCSRHQDRAAPVFQGLSPTQNGSKKRRKIDIEMTNAHEYEFLAN